MRSLIEFHKKYANHDWATRIMALILVALTLVGCASLGRYRAVPLEQASDVHFLGKPDIRFYANSAPDRMIDVAMHQLKKRER